MRYLPFSIALEMKRTRTGWTLVIQVRFNFEARGAGESSLLTPETYHFSQHFQVPSFARLRGSIVVLTQERSTRSVRDD
jgi:hypothetical protein